MLNTAQKLYTGFLGVDPDFYNRETANVAVDQIRQITAYSRAPHAYRPTPARRKKRVSGLTLPKLFKGHRP